MTDMNMTKHSNREGSYSQVSGDVYSAVTVDCTVKEAPSGSMWLQYYFQVPQMTCIRYEYLASSQNKNAVDQNLLFNSDSSSEISCVSSFVPCSCTCIPLTRCCSHSDRVK